ncbi:FKBP-type peptidyl-prolyl cis-trans isomerase [Eleftheria terrae]|uniref:FKBP-type peptidyl-prolyl cis-trans isomerase n=1 Tax=Eleftheria terrae TaxID=1597781 RepID=UPI00263A7B47|nr:peptidylprolyl isomerase [Eleftheria terrae]WKB52606.1 peptidylprolyl isomerase [Eleftheria terrae]
MLISTPCVVSLTWRLQDTLGHLIDELAEPVEFLYGGDDLLPKVEEAIEGQQAGFETQIQLEPEHAFGDYNPELVFFEERSIFPEHVEPGMQFDGLPEGATTQGMPNDQIYTITEVYETHVVLDGNHPLAGIALRLSLKVAGVRAATEEEIEQGTVGQPAVTVLNTVPGGSQLH